MFKYLLLLSLFVFSSCSTKNDVEESTSFKKDDQSFVKNDIVEEKKIVFKESPKKKLKDFTFSKEVFFAFDSSVLTKDAKRVLNGYVLVLKNTSDVKINIEGHCDDRGSEAYNLALGQRRADAVKRFLIRKGVEEDKIKTVSYGESKPVSKIWAKNRRGVIISAYKK